MQSTGLAPWLIVSLDHATGSAYFQASVNESFVLAAGNGSYAGHLTFDGPEISTPRSVVLRLDLYREATSSAPFGSFDSPAANAGGITGSLPMGGWALDDIEVSRVAITRDPVASEPPGVPVYIGDAVFVEGARPDVAAVSPTAPLKSRAGWGYMLLTNMLPNQGNGTYTLHRSRGRLRRPHDRARRQEITCSQPHGDDAVRHD